MIKAMTTPRAPIAVAAGVLALTAWLASSQAAGVSAAQQATRPQGWNESTHGVKVRPDYQRLFGLDSVHEIRITIAPESYRAMREDLQTIGRGGRGRPGGPGGQGRGGGPRGDGFAPPPGGNVFIFDPPPGGIPDGGQGPPQGGAGGPRGGRGAIRMTARDPIYVPVTVAFEGGVWTGVGMRYKGNSSLMSAGFDGNSKVPFRLDFDRYEDERPEIRDQRIHGFSKLTFSSNMRDLSQLREVMANEIFRDRGVPAPRAAFYRVLVDTGSGPEYWGLYSMIEDPADGPMLDAQFGSRSGNLYKPDGPGATWTAFDAESFEKKTNKKKADWSDVSSAIAALHAPKADRRAWRAGLEATFDVDLFLRWLAVNSVIDNWDVYGTMSHNYYVYGDPAKKGQLRWIPWDNNEALGRSGGPGAGGRGGPRGGPPPGGDFVIFGPGGPPPGGQPPPGGPRGGGPQFGGRGSADDVLQTRVGSQWPLIRILLDDEVYAARYREHLRFALGGLFAPEAFSKRARELRTLIANAAIEESKSRGQGGSREAFDQTVDGPGGLVEFVKRRHEVVRVALEGPPAR
jgi:hypothetical protein